MKQIACIALFLLAPFTFGQHTDRLDLTLVEGAHDPVAGTISLHVSVANRTNRVAAAQLTLHVNPMTVQPLLDPSEWACSGSAPSFVCQHVPLQPQTEHPLDLTLRFPDRAGRAFVDLSLIWNFDGTSGSAYKQARVALIKPFVVRNTSDDGEGSLRRAIHDLNGDRVCSTHPCGISFNIEGASAWQTIAPLSPLPPIVAADLFIDATTQSDTNPVGPDIELLGTNVGSGHGLEIHGAVAVVRGLAIGGFPGNGIQYHPTVHGSVFTFEKNYIGVDPTGTRAVANGLRGITIEEGIVTNSDIRDNVLSGNVRSGLFIVTRENPGFPLAPVIRVTRNRIESNGASGIFCGPRSEQILIADNVIANHRDFGIAIAHGARYVDVGVNRMANNAVSAIDIGLDGPTGAERATLESATYDAATDTTTIVGRGPGSGFGFITFSHALYASTRANDVEQRLGDVTPNGDGRFTFSMKGDLRGRYVNAITRRTLNADGSLIYNTSEMSNAILVR